MRQVVRFFLMAAVIAALSQTAARADAVGDWNAIAVQATLNSCPVPTCVPAIPARPGPTGVIDIAIVQAAIYDAVQAIEKEYEPYYADIPGANGSSVAATAKAAHDVLVSRFPWQADALDDIYDNYLLSKGILPDNPGIVVGAIAAANIIALRANDGSFPNPAPTPFNGGTDPGVWRPTPPANASMLAPWLATVTPFTMRSPSQFRANQPPPALKSPEYTRDYNEVKALGADNSPRTFEQNELANFWNSNYVVLWNSVLRNLANLHVDNIADSARLFALADMSMADSIITSWDSKLHFVFWRPITAIRLGHTDGNPNTIAAPAWNSLLTTPPYPDYTSGANNISRAALRSFALFFGTEEMTFQITTTNPGPTVQDTRTYNLFADAAEEVVDARVYQGIHFRFADTAARKQGKQIAQWAFSHFFRPRSTEVINGIQETREQNVKAWPTSKSSPDLRPCPVNTTFKPKQSQQ
ncbi:MAG TPA: vanadium-dependent haloperoxidase [Pyrinomonadaceae bacterium]|nr:vanadium-dependent haloperoxidase [Pyrinomonadaceae bacterium]